MDGSTDTIRREGRERLDDWASPDGDLARYVLKERNKTLEGYGTQPNWVVEHFNLEQDTAHGGYRNKQILELVSNSADALWTEPGNDEGVADNGQVTAHSGRIEVRLTKDYLYCADDGRPIGRSGMRALMFSHLSPRRGTNQIGTFGLGFKAVLAVSDSPDFFSRSGSFSFDRDRARAEIREVVPDGTNYPVLRLPTPVHPSESFAGDAVLRELSEWAHNIVRLQLKPGAHTELRDQMTGFPAEFLLFVDHVGTLKLADDSGSDRTIELEQIDDEHVLLDGDNLTRWRLFCRQHELSDRALADQRPGDDRKSVPVWWAAPIDKRIVLRDFWAFFPTHTKSLVPGILNAAWKTNEDRQNLLSGPFNVELIKASAAMIADVLPNLITDDDPARHLDMLPRRPEAGDNDHANLLRRLLLKKLYDREIIPNQTKALYKISDLHYPPSESQYRLEFDTILHMVQALTDLGYLDELGQFDITQQLDSLDLEDIWPILWNRLDRFVGTKESDENRKQEPNSLTEEEQGAVLSRLTTAWRRTKLVELWEGVPARPENWLHHKAMTRTRLSATDRLFQQAHTEGFSS